MRDKPQKTKGDTAVPKWQARLFELCLLYFYKYLQKGVEKLSLK